MMKLSRVTLFVSVALLISNNLLAQLHAASIFGNDMVLQRHKPIMIWGWADPKKRVSVNFNAITRYAKADARGNWQVEFPAMEAGGPFKMSVTDGNSKIHFSDILVGDVWFCSGQSNMEFKVVNEENARSEVSKASYPSIRHIKIANSLSLSPEKDIPAADWQVASPATAGDFTAVGYSFAVELYNKLHIPIGLINCSWGGSQVESWISKPALQSSAAFNYCVPLIAANWQQSFEKQERLLKEFFNTNKISTGNITTAGYDFSGWRFNGSPGNYDWAWPWGFRGNFYTEHDVIIDTIQQKLASIINLGVNDSPHKIYLNGKLIEEGASPVIQVKLPPGTWNAGLNRLLMISGAQVNPDWMGMGIHGNPGQVNVDFSGEKVSLEDGKWRTLPDLTDNYHFVSLNNTEATAIYNAMVAPIEKYKIEGVIWYQGEANTSRAYQYRHAFPLLINSWRKQRSDDIPFYFVQLSSYGKNPSANEGSDWAELREAQTLTLKVPNTGMAVTTDIGNADDIHPKNKKTVGERLAYIALKKLYGMDVPYSGPTYNSVSFQQKNAIIQFANTYGGLEAHDKFGYLRGFEIAGSDHVFHYATASIEGDKVIVSCPAVANPVAVRYAWSNAPTDANLFNKAGLPASPFRTDDWAGITQNSRFGIN